MLQGDHSQNFRNLIAHGLMTDARLNSAMGLYVWWLVLRITLRFSPEFRDYVRGEAEAAAAAAKGADEE